MKPNLGLYLGFDCQGKHTMKSEMASTLGFYNKNELHGSPMANDRWMPNHNC